MKRHLLFLTVAALGIIGCSETDDAPEIDGGRYSTCFIQDYVEAEKITAFADNESGMGFVAEGTLIDGTLLASTYGDTGFNSHIAPHSTQVIANQFISMELVCDSDYDDQHKAGSSLADIVFLAGASPRDFIRSGYLSSFDWNLAPEFYVGNRSFASYHAKYAPVYLRLSEIDGDSLMLLDPRFFLVFTTPPTSGAAHSFTLTITDNKGKEIRLAFDWTGKS
ncbi:hypothetical protein [uncultured Alistipes sp.]|uniref:hypothetical protein n=1 Tax=uncultured Alistipes sp. TaxID=538949 RepID=UPI002607C43F|nr:hypothetical protein [uncultured Alistipes sp.]